MGAFIVKQDFRLTGVQTESAFFRFEERNEFDPEPVMDVLRGRRLGVIFRDAIPEDAKKETVARFWSSPGLLRRDGEPSYCIGSYHWNKSTESYLKDAATTADAVLPLLDVPHSPWRSFRSAMAEELARYGASIRIAEHEGEPAGAALIRAWDKEGSFALDPHEDEAQCTDPRQAGFEIQRAADYEICAVNMCVQQGDGGRLVVWNIRPDDDSRTSLGIQHTGFSYPAATLEPFDAIQLDVRSGDVYVFNGRHVHAVDACKGHRTNVSFLMGFVDERTVVTWT
ncbi:hypothetical protein SAMN05216223_11577 [Actinacidiphila yanglinensis]|uniref:Fe2OG dioxygenase domain-containing protein n=1 Tax=Actinacidiphila yanglinensis TaxID=310779 RepID=A0A1H6DGU3_9ACTN|nr:hypothetical protein [Actinacidiphila yanglinensis]SEG84450.1 hypothetical protein SAMN05216223_11577 [Actinacidiphila yanglinensis]